VAHTAMPSLLHQPSVSPHPTSAATQQGMAQHSMAQSTTTYTLPKGVLTELLTSGMSVGAANTATNPLVRVFLSIKDPS